MRRKTVVVIYICTGIHKRMVQFRKLTRNLFLTLRGHNVHRQQRQLSKFLMRYQQFSSHAYCGTAGPVSKMASHLCAPFWGVQICDYSAVQCTVYKRLAEEFSAFQYRLCSMGLALWEAKHRLELWKFNEKLPIDITWRESNVDLCGSSTILLWILTLVAMNVRIMLSETLLVSWSVS